MATTTTQQLKNSSECVDGGIGRMSDDEYEAEFNGATPRPGSSDADNAAAALAASQAKQVWTFSQAAATRASKSKLKIKSRTHYRMAANLKVQQAINHLETRLQQLRESNSGVQVMSEKDFRLLKQAISNFCVRIVVHDSITFDALNEAQKQTAAELTHQTSLLQPVMMTAFESPSFSEAHAVFIERQKEKIDDLKAWNATLTTEIRRLLSLASKERIPAQQAELTQSSRLTLQNVLSPTTIRRKFISLNALTQTVRNDLIAFLKDDCRTKDRATVVQQIKDSCASVAMAAAAAAMATTPAAPATEKKKRVAKCSSSSSS
jgi:hypothetical protein